MKRYIPNQHGAWAMLAVPYILGVAAAGARPIHALMFVCWLLAYLFSFPVLQWVRTGRKERYRGPALLYGGLLLPAGAALLLLEPRLIYYGLALLPLLAVNGIYARMNRERTVVNDLTAIVQFSSVVFPVYYLGGGDDWDLASTLFVLCVLYFTGTVYYVKTLIREKGNPVFYAGSVLYHLLLGAAALWYGEPLLLLLSGFLLARSALIPRIGLTVKQSGILEIGVSALVAVLTIQAVL
ncbi:YwiC-like family protein [Gorillibacterium sp. sgz5001074]|uniref:YwiC-like family protein n=1 Tax=Gorillibacterium sp. sgz5001074 TaxID=3446695 RepID=UPI003F66951A